MSASFTYDLLSRGRAAAKAKETKEARFYLERLLNMGAPVDERMEACFWLSEVSEDPTEKRSLLEEILANNFGDARARRKLAILDGKIKPEEIVDPDHLNTSPPGEPQAADARSFTCPRCGGRRSFAPDGQTLLCEYCETRELIENNGHNRSEDFTVAMATAKAHRHAMIARTITCRGCGALMILPPEVLTTDCPYCDTPYALEQVEQRELDAPDTILPFAIDRQAARAAMIEWFRQDPPDENPKVAPVFGVYLPVWLFDVGGEIKWAGTITRNKHQIPISGARVVSHPNLLVPATRRLPAALLPALEGFNLSKLQSFDLRHLAGWPAETHQVTASDASLKAREAALQLERQDIEITENPPINQLRLNSSSMLVDSYRLVLLPAWLTYYMLEERKFEVLINGQNGQVTAERPAKGLLGWVKNLLD